jgi:DNA repair protein RecO (recombination protein O)
VAQEKSEAIVLRGVDFGDSSRIVTLITPDRGKVAVMAKGARRKGSPLAAVLDTFNRIEIVYAWKSGREVQTLMEAALLDAYPGVKADLGRSAYAAFPLELAGRAAHENEPSVSLYAALVHGLAGMDRWRDAPGVHAVWQALLLLEAAGFAPALDHCARCGGPLRGTVYFTPAGGAACGGCGGERRLGAKTLERLRVLDRNREVCAVREEVPEAFQLLRQYAAWQFDCGFRSIRVIDELFGQERV